MINNLSKRGILSMLLALLFSYLNSNAQYPGTSAQKVASFHTATYNIRYDAAADKETGNNWDLRKQALAQLILTHNFEILGTQEGMIKQMIELKKLLPDYDYIGYPYGGKNDHHQAGIVYKTSLFEPLDAGVFWLSQTPDIPSIGWDANDRRICQWAKFRHKKSGKIFFFFNAHFFWQKQSAKQNSGPLIVQKIKEIAGQQTAICVGDFNSTVETSQVQALKSFLSDAYDISKNGRKGVENTNLGGGNFQNDPIDRIDYIMLTKDIVASDYQVYSDKYRVDRYPSDHLPVSCIVKF